MGRLRVRASRFAGVIETLEERRLMAADPLTDLLPPPLELTTATAPPLEQHVAPAGDFWVDPGTQISFDEYVDGIDQFLASAHALTGWSNVQANYGFRGRGQTVAVIDSGIAYDHIALGSGFGNRVVGGWDFTEENEGNPYDDGASGGHGTHVSGIIGSSSSTHSGVAPGVDLVGLRVFNDAGSGYFNWVENALRWVHTNRNSFANPITAVNLSLGVSSWNADSIPLWANLEDEFAQLEADGIFIAVSAGNSFGSFNAPGLSYPAASPYVVPVMSADDNGALSYYSQRLQRAIAAPGRSITSTVPDYLGNNNGIADDYASMSGTSMASPYLAGASVLIREAMQLVGTASVNQDAIYNHMMATADSVFDSATSLSYKRLNLQRAIDALMPADDFGSTLGSAYNLGTLTAGQSFQGMIGKLNDVDCFKLTAGATGRVTFTASNLTSNVAPSWQVYNSSGVSIASGSGASIGFDAVSGQTYTVSLGSPTGVGRYTLAASLGGGGGGGGGGTFTYSDWGGASFTQRQGVAVSGEAWYRIQAAQTGTLAVQGIFSAGGGSASVELYNANLQKIAAGATGAGWTISQADVTANSYYFVRVAGANSSVNFSLANLVSRNGSTVTVSGTSGSDYFQFHAGGSSYFWINGVFHFTPGAAANVVFQGGSGADAAVVVGTSAAETATLRIGTSTVVGSGYSVTLHSVENAGFHGNGGADQANFYDTAGDDTFRSYSDRAELVAAGGRLSTLYVNRNYAFAGAGNDTALLYDTVGNDTLTSWGSAVFLAGSGYSNLAQYFETTTAIASGGADTSTMFDTSGDETFEAWNDRASLAGAGWKVQANNFDRSQAFASAGNDQAVFCKATNGDAYNYRAQGNYGEMAGSGYYRLAQYFDATELDDLHATNASSLAADEASAAAAASVAARTANGHDAATSRPQVGPAPSRQTRLVDAALGATASFRGAAFRPAIATATRSAAVGSATPAHMSQPLSEKPTADALDELFAEIDAELVDAEPPALRG